MSPSHPASSPEFLEKLFPLPASTGNVVLPGSTHASATVLIEKLKHNFVHNHGLFDSEHGYHNHVVDDVLAVYGLGGSAELVKVVYDDHQKSQAPLIKTEPITDDNFLEHLGDYKFYKAYLVYFANYLLTHSPTEAIEHFVFSNEFNYISNLDTVNAADKKAGKPGMKKQPEMLNRFLAGLLHPYIHLSYGVEFGIPAVVAEGLAQSAIHPDHQTEVIPYSFFSSTDSLLTGFSNLSISASPIFKPSTPPFFAYHKALMDDPELSPSALNLGTSLDYENTVKNAGPRILQHTNAWYDSWLAGVSDTNEIELRLELMTEEVIFGNMLWYGVGGWAARKTDDRVLNADFFTMHLVTSAIFLPNLILPTSPAKTLQPALSLRSRLLLLRTFAATCAAWTVARGRTSTLPIAAFYAATNPFLTAPPPAPSPSATAASEQKLYWSPGSPRAVGASPWPRIWANTLVHPNEHLHKLVRACAAFANWYGEREEGHYAGADGGLDGVEVLDGTLPLRVAAITMERIGWAYEGAELRQWDRDGLF